MTKELMLGNEAVARGAYEAGVTVASAYPGTPSTEITEYIAKYDNIYCEWSPNEKVALEVAIGAAFGGARAICSMKHVGVNVAADPLFTASYTGVNGGLVIMAADDPGMHSSQNEQDTRNYGLAAMIPVLEPSDSQECLDFVKAAFILSETFDTPVIVRLTTRIAHSRSLVNISEPITYQLKDYTKDIAKRVMMPAMARQRHVEVEARLRKLEEWAETTELNTIVGAEGSKPVGAISSGISYQYIKEASLGAPDEEIVPVLKLGMVYPLPIKKIQAFAKRFEKLYVVEELFPFLEDNIKKEGIAVTGKAEFPLVGELSAHLVKNVIYKSEQESSNEQTAPQNIPGRPPVLCPGCPHRGVFYILNKLRLNVFGDIGCYTLGALSPFEAMDACVCMGASIGMAHGINKARGSDFAKKTVAVIGDSTFIHSGITGLINMIYNKGNSTVLILDNSITGMTGHQDNPATGYTIRREETIQLNLEKLCEALGIPDVRVVDPFDTTSLEETLKEELNKAAPSVIIARRPCALLKSYQPGNQVSIDNNKCTHCRQCMGISCTAISDSGGQISINEAYCVRCGLCEQVCKFGAIVTNAEEA